MQIVDLRRIHPRLEGKRASALYFTKNQTRYTTILFPQHTYHPFKLSPLSRLFRMSSSVLSSKPQTQPHHTYPQITPLFNISDYLNIAAYGAGMQNYFVYGIVYVLVNPSAFVSTVV